MVKWNNFVEWAFLGLITYFAYSLNNNISELQKGMIELNSQVKIILTESSNSKELIKDHENRLRFLEEINRRKR